MLHVSTIGLEVISRLPKTLLIPLLPGIVKVIKQNKKKPEKKKKKLKLNNAQTKEKHISSQVSRCQCVAESRYFCSRS